MISQPKIQQTAQLVESMLAAYYRFDAVSAVTDHFVTREEVLANLQLHDNSNRSSDFQDSLRARGSVWLFNDQQKAGDVFLGVHLCKSLENQLRSNDPLKQLNGKNLDSFCVIVEEVSHFHLILNRAAQNRTVTPTELEWQGDIDKLVISSLILDEQCGDPHLIQLARLIFDHSSIDESNDIYRDANSYAAKYWFDLLRQVDHPQQIRHDLQEKYAATWQQKVGTIAA